MLDPGRGKTKTGYLWAIARDDRPWGGGADGPAESGLASGKTGHPEHKGSGPPAVAYSYAPGRGAEHAVRLLDGFHGILQVDGYAAYKKLAAPARPGRPVTQASTAVRQLGIAVGV